ncbi:4-hydroxy-tetrahydrodipicolinate synthase [Candidatus Thorarchaeota archaeon]|nr:MAG: 4-hydroxy-tetrahydrodipicolinate synthase [Candidatus Thorarchaeota archaeon]
MVSKFELEGVMPALVTPFTRDGDIIEDGFREVIDYTIEKGATGVVPAGTTGEFVYMRTEERKKLLKLAVEYVDGRVPVIAGTGQNSTRATIAMTQYAADIGCDAALVVSPFYLRPSAKGYYEHYAAVARKGNLPIILYNIPQCTLGELGSNLVYDLAALDNVAGIKDSSGNIGKTVELIQKLDGRIPVLIGHDECFLSAVAAGAKAAILASANVIPHFWLDIMKKVREGKIDEAMRIQHSVQTFARIVTRNGGAPPVKAALKMMGINAGKSRLPLNTGGTLTVELKDDIRMELEKLELITSILREPLVSELDLVALFKEFDIPAEFLEGAKIGQASNEQVSATIAIGTKGGGLGRAFVKLLTQAKVGHEALSVILEPNLFVKPSSIMVPARPIQSMRQASLFYGPVQSGAAKAIAAYLDTGRISSEELKNDVIVMALDVDLNSRDRRDVTDEAENAVGRALADVWG